MQLIWSAQKPADPPGKDNHYPDNSLQRINTHKLNIISLIHILTAIWFIHKPADPPGKDNKNQNHHPNSISPFFSLLDLDYKTQLTLTTLITIYAVFWSAHKPADPPGKDNHYPDIHLNLKTSTHNKQANKGFSRLLGYGTRDIA